MTPNAVSRCPNGKQGSLISWQPAVHSFSPAIHFFDCSDSSSRLYTRNLNVPSVERGRFHSRQAPFSCQAPCSTTCSTNQSPPPNPNDCDDLSRWMWQRDTQYPVNPDERIVLSWGTCMYAFTNAMQHNVTWCDAQWAQIGAYIARPCLAQSNGGGTCAGDGFLVEVLSNDGSTNIPVPYTEVPIPFMTTVSPSYTSTAVSGYGTSYTVPVIPVVLGVVGGVTFLLIILVGVFFTRRRLRRENIPFASEDTHDVRPKPSQTSYGMKGKALKHELSTIGSHSTTLPRPASPTSGSRVSTRLSTYSIEFDPFRSLRRALSGRRRQPTPIFK